MHLSDYLALPWTVQIFREHDPEQRVPNLVAQVLELPGLITCGDSMQELWEMLDDAMRLWIASAMADGQAIPVPGGKP